MGQGMDDKIRQISQMLNSPEAQDGIRQLFSSLGASGGDTPAETDRQPYDGPETDLQMRAVSSQFQEMDWINHIQNLLGQMNNMQDSRVNLLRSIHPFLNPTRRERCTTCVNILKIASILRALTNDGGRLL